jgi:hypothetical protein
VKALVKRNSQVTAAAEAQQIILWSVRTDIPPPLNDDHSDRGTSRYLAYNAGPMTRS